MEDDIRSIVQDTLQKNKQAIIFLPSRASAEKTAEDLSKTTSLFLAELPQQILDAVTTPTRQCKRLSFCTRKGVAFHHAGLTESQKDLVEAAFRQGTIKIICATPTLAAGLSLPAYRVIIKSLKRYSGAWGMDWIPVLEYLQMAGRAGRPEYEKEGQAISLAKSAGEKEDIYEKYICGVPEEITSKLAVEPVLRTYLLSLISCGIIRDEQTLHQFFSKTFWAHQFQDMGRLQLLMQKMLQLLKGWKFISMDMPDSGEFVSAEQLASNETRYRQTLLGKRVSELYLDPFTANYFLQCFEKYQPGRTAFSLLQMACHTLEMRPLLRLKVKDAEIIQAELLKRGEELLDVEPSPYDPEYDEFSSSIKTALFLEAWCSEMNEDVLLETFDIRPGEIRVKLEAADWLLYSSQELAKLQNARELVREIGKLRTRLRYGIREELLPLIQLRGIGRVRARKLFSQGIKSIEDVKKMDITSLGQLLGPAVASDVKRQLGEEVEVVPEGRRKGQLSVEKFVG